MPPFDYDDYDNDPLFQAVCEELNRQAEEALAEFNRNAMDDLWRRINQALEIERQRDLGFEEWERERIERETAISDLMFECGYGPEVAE